MNSSFSKTPFLLLLLAIISGVLLQYYVDNTIWGITSFLLGVAVMLFSFFLNRGKQFAGRWIFGVGSFFAFVAVGAFSTYIKQEKQKFTFSDDQQIYVGYITDTPQDKPRSLACKIHLPDNNADVVCYLQKNTTKKMPEVGEEIVFYTALQPIHNFGNPDEFDYKRYMYNQGFVASAYLSDTSWLLTGNANYSLKIRALQVRQKAMDLFKQMGFTDEEQAVLSALTLGYQDTLSDDLKQNFRKTGTVHVLSVSGLHVGIIYGLIVLLLSFISHTKLRRLRPLFLIILLWGYAYITGLPASVVRASIMLSAFCVAELFGKNSSSLNNLYLAAFFMLLYNPFQLFDIGFQLSFVSVLSILLLHSRLVNAVDVKNKYLRKVWSLLAISLVAQLATFPLCLYYFGTFPTYFFLANLLIVPLVSVIIYGVGLVLAVWLVASQISVVESVLSFFVEAVKGLVSLMVWLIDLFSSLPFSLMEGVKISFLELLLVFATITLSLVAVVNYKSKAMIIALASLSFLLMLNIVSLLQPKERKLTVYNRNGSTEITYQSAEGSYSLDSLLTHHNNPVLDLEGKKFLIVNKQIGEQLFSERKLHVDYVILMGLSHYSFPAIEQLYRVDTVIFDNSLKPYVRRQLAKECENRAIPFYDVSQKGAFSINF